MRSSAARGAQQCHGRSTLPTVTRKQLSNAVELLAANLLHPVTMRRRMGCTFWDLREAHTVADIAQTLAQEQGEPPTPNCALWAEAAETAPIAICGMRKSFIPMAPARVQVTVGLCGTPQRKHLNGVAIELYSPRCHARAKLPNDLPPRFARSLPSAKARSGYRLQRDELARIDALLEALQASATEASSLPIASSDCASRRRDVRAMDFSFLFDDPASSFPSVIAPPTALWIQLLRPARLRSAPRQLHRHRERRCPLVALVSSWPRA